MCSFLSHPNQSVESYLIPLDDKFKFSIRLGILGRALILFSDRFSRFRNLRGFKSRSSPVKLLLEISKSVTFLNFGKCTSYSQSRLQKDRLTRAEGLGMSARSCTLRFGFIFKFLIEIITFESSFYAL